MRRGSVDNKRFFTVETLRKWGWAGLLVMALIAGCNPAGGQDKRNQAPPVPNPTPALVDSSITPSPVETLAPGTSAPVETPVPVTHPPAPVLATSPSP